MTINDIENIFSARYSKYSKSITIVSEDDDNHIPLCISEEKMYSFDDIMEDNHKCEGVIPHSWDGISFKDGYINFIEFKNVDIHKNSKVKREIRFKMAEGLQILERCILGNEFLINHNIKTRFILVYSKLKNEKYLLSKENKERKARNQLSASIRSFSTLPPINHFIGNKFHEKWHYVTESASMNEEDFMKNLSRYI